MVVPIDSRSHETATLGEAQEREDLRRRFAAVRRFTEELCEPLATEDYVVQTMTDVSPTKWHLAHVSWFFETFILSPHLDGYRSIDERYAYLFNSYYVQAGERHCRDQRGYISRPTVAEVYDYRRHVDEGVHRLLESADQARVRRLRPILEIGLNHEQQHQELLLTDIKHVLSVNPLRPPYRSRAAGPSPAAGPGPVRWVEIPGRLYEVGHAGDGFAYDNETPRHKHYQQPFALADRLVTNGEFLDFMADGGYSRPELWLSEGWATVEHHGWTEPFYWERRDDGWQVYTLTGMRPLDPNGPVTHISYFEADAFARWSGHRLPTEQEWEIAASPLPVRGNFVESGRLHPAPAEPAPAGTGLRQMYGDVWEWTRSQYSPYPGYAPPAGAIGEYNGKFMCNQFVLRGGSCATSKTHIRPTYRNFFKPDSTWQFTGIRLVRDL